MKKLLAQQLGILESAKDDNGNVPMRLVRQAYKKLEENVREERWIPCSERLPSDAGYYLTTTTYNEVYCDYYYWNLNEWNRTEQVIAWMPLPEPYEGKDGGGA